MGITLLQPAWYVDYNPGKGSDAYDGMGWRSVVFTSGGGAYTPVAGDVLTGHSSTKTVTIDWISETKRCVWQANMNDNAASTVVTAQVGANATAFANTSTYSVAGTLNTAFNFASTASDRMLLPAGLPTGASARSWEFWLTLNGHAAVYGLFSTGTYAGTRTGFTIYAKTDKKLYFWDATTAEAALSNTALTDNNATWYHLVITYDGSTTITGYLNGGVGNTITPAAVLATADSNQFIGLGYPAGAGKYWKGCVDCSRCFNYALSADDVAVLYNAGAGTETTYGAGSTPGGVAWAAGEQTGTFYLLDNPSGTFVAEDLDVGAHANVATIAGDTSLCAKKTIDGVTAALLTPGDTIKIAQSPIPVNTGLTATWTNNSNAVTLSGAANTTISNCESGWTQPTNITLTYSTAAYCQGSKSVKIVTGAGFAGGDCGHIDFGSQQDWHTFEQISFMIIVGTSGGTMAAGDFKISMYSDAAMTIPCAPATIDFPAVPSYSTTNWIPIVLNTGAALPSNVRVMAITHAAALASKTYYFDNFILVKAASSVDAISHQSLISKNTAAQGGNEGWYPIASIDGTAIKLFCGGTATQTGGKYGQTTNAVGVALWRRETIKTTMVAAVGTAVQTLQEAGTYGNINWYKGGYNPATGNQTGETFFDGLNGFGKGITSSSNYTTLSRMSSCRYGQGYALIDALGVTIDTVQTLCGHSAYGIATAYSSAASSGLSLTSTSNVINNAAGFELTYADSIAFINPTGVSLNISGSPIGINMDYTVNGVIYADTITMGSNGNDFAINGGPVDLTLYNLTHTNSTGAVVAIINASTPFRVCAPNASIDTTSVSSGTACRGHLFWCPNYATSGHPKGWTDGITIETETGTVPAGATHAWKFTITSATKRTSEYPLRFPIASVYCAASTAYTVTAKFYRDDTLLTGSLLCRANQLPGYTEQKDTMDQAATNWETLSVSFTPSLAGVVTVEAEAYCSSGTTHYLLVGGVQISPNTIINSDTAFLYTPTNDSMFPIITPECNIGTPVSHGAA